MEDRGLLPEGPFDLQSHNRDLEVREGIAKDIRQPSSDSMQSAPSLLVKAMAQR
jgi:hypothetical protein